METYQELRDNLKNNRSEEKIIEMVKGLLQAGHSKEQIMAALRKIHFDLSTNGDENDDNLVLNIMDYLEGWCSPHMKI